jgi:recombination protein RecT
MNENTSPVNAVATRTAATPARSVKNDVRSILERMKPQIAAALPRHITPDRMLRVALTAVNSTPALLKCDQTSLLSAVMQCAQLGLEPGGVLGHAYLLPYGDRCQLIVGYKGLLDLARRSGQVRTISANNVYSNEKFVRVEGMERNLEHVPLPPSKRGDYVGTYAVAKLRDDSFHFEWMWAEEVDAIRKRSRASNNGPWVTDTDEMRRKTVVRRLVKYLPISVELSRAAALDEAHEVGLPTADMDVTEFQIEDTKPEPQTIEKALAAPAEKKPEEKAPESTQSQTIAEGNAALAAETLNAKRERTAQALARKGFKGAKVLQFIGATIGTATQVDTLTGPECDRVLEALA